MILCTWGPAIVKRVDQHLRSYWIDHTMLVLCAEIGGTEDVKTHLPSARPARLGLPRGTAVSCLRWNRRQQRPNTNSGVRRQHTFTSPSNIQPDTNRAKHHPQGPGSPARAGVIRPPRRVQGYTHDARHKHKLDGEHQLRVMC